MFLIDALDFEIKSDDKYLLSNRLSSSKSLAQVVNDEEKNDLVNSSPIAKILLGIIKNTSVCGKCKNENIVIDPFSILSLSIPVNYCISVSLIFIPYELTKKPFKMELNIDVNSIVFDLRKEIAKLIKMPLMSFALCTMENNRIDKILGPRDDIKNLDFPLFAYQIESDEFKNSKYNEDPKLEEFTGRIGFYDQIDEFYRDDLDPEFANTHQFFRILDDNNFGLRPIFLPFVMNVLAFDPQNTVRRPIQMTPQRFLLISKNLTFKELYSKIFDYFKGGMSGNVQFEDFQYFIMQNNKIPEDAEEQEKLKVPFVLRLKFNNSDFCYIHGQECFCCNLPINNTSLESVLDKMPLSGKKKVDNSYLYLSNNQREYTVERRDIELEVVFLNAYRFELSKLNRCTFKRFGNFVKKGTVSLYDCLDNCFEEEKLTGITCAHCKETTNFTRKSKFDYLPNELIIHLKRFKNSSEKIDKLVECPMEDLNLTKFTKMGAGKRYELMGVIKHKGGPVVGHYMAAIKLDSHNQWFNFNDHIVSRIKRKEEVIDETAYVLFYRIKDKN